MLSRGSYLAYKRETSRLVYLLLTASNAVLSLRSPAASLNTTGKLDSSGFIPAAEIIVKYMRSVPREILCLLKSVIELRSSHYAEFQHRVSTNPNFEVEESNKSHKYFIDVLTRAFNVLGGEAELRKGGEDKAKMRNSDSDDDAFKAEFSNMFQHLDLHDVQGDEGEVAEASDCEDDCKKIINGRRKIGPSKYAKKKNAKCSRNRAKTYNKGNQQYRMPLDQYGIANDDHYIAAEYFLAVSSILEQSIDLRHNIQNIWNEVAYKNHQPLTATALSSQCISIIQRSLKTISDDFPGSHSYLSLINSYTNGGVSNLQQKTMIRLCRKQNTKECCVRFEETQVAVEPMKELLMIHAYNDLLAYLEDYRQSSSGMPSKKMQAKIRDWDPEYDLKAATKCQRIQWRRIYTVNWLYGLVGYYLKSKMWIEEESTFPKACRRSPRPWAENYSFFGLGDFTRSIIGLTRKPKGSQLQYAISPLLIFQLQCVVDSFTASRGWQVGVLGHIVRAPPQVEENELPEKQGMIGWYEKVTCAHDCAGHQGVTRSQELLLQLYARNRTRHCAFGKDTLFRFWHSWWDHDRVIISLRNNDAQCHETSDNGWRLNEYDLFTQSPFLCGFAILQTIELYYRYVMYIWDSTPEIVLMIHLHNMLVKSGHLVKALQLMEDLTTWFQGDFFGEERPTSNFIEAYRSRKGALRFTSVTQLISLLMDTPAYRQFHMGEHIFKTRPSLLVLHEANWEVNSISTTREASLPQSALLKEIIPRLRNHEQFSSRKYFIQLSKTKGDLDLPHFCRDSKHLPETTVLGLCHLVVDDDVLGNTPLSGMNFLAITAKLLSIWVAIGEKLELSGLMPSGDAQKVVNPSDKKDPVESMVEETMLGTNESLTALMVEVFEESRGEGTNSFSYFARSSNTPESEESDKGDEHSM